MSTSDVYMSRSMICAALSAISGCLVAPAAMAAFESVSKVPSAQFFAGVAAGAGFISFACGIAACWNLVRAMRAPQ